MNSQSLIKKKKELGFNGGESRPSLIGLLKPTCRGDAQFLGRASRWEELEKKREERQEGRLKAKPWVDGIRSSQSLVKLKESQNFHGVVRAGEGGHRQKKRLTKDR